MILSDTFIFPYRSSKRCTDTSDLRHFGPRIKICFECRHCVKKVDPLYIRYCNEWRCLENDRQKLYLTSLLRVSSHALSAMNIIGREAEECNCSKQRRDDVCDASADSDTDRGVSDMTIIATNYR